MIAISTCAVPEPGRGCMTSISRFITQRLKLRVNSAKSAVDHPWNRSFLGFSFTGGKRPKRRKIAPKALARFKARVKALTKRNQGRSLKHVITTLVSVSARVDWLFRLLPDASSPAGLGQLDTPSSAMSPVETLEDVSPTQGGVNQARHQPRRWPIPRPGVPKGRGRSAIRRAYASRSIITSLIRWV